MHKFLIIRRDNIGDLVCTTPLIHSLRQRFPTARIDALVNSYNVDAVSENIDLNRVYAYTKIKHRSSVESSIGVYWRRIKMYWELFSRRYDYVILADTKFTGRALLMARWLSPKHIIGFASPNGMIKALDIPIQEADINLHVVEQLSNLLAPFGVNGPPPLLHLRPNKTQAQFARKILENLTPPADAPLIGLHISARKPSQRWQAEKFVALARQLHGQYAARFVLFWSPGDENNPLHPGDDQKAQTIIANCKDLPIKAFATSQLSQLIAGLSCVDQVICSDGGAMHIAAGLGKPIVCFFGNSSVVQWHPWRVPYIALQPESRQVGDISTDEVMNAYAQLLKNANTENLISCNSF